jgi:hypothetical protein
MGASKLLCLRRDSNSTGIFFSIKIAALVPKETPEGVYSRANLLPPLEDLLQIFLSSKDEQNIGKVYWSSSDR